MPPAVLTTVPMTLLPRLIAPDAVSTLSFTALPPTLTTVLTVLAMPFAAPHAKLIGNVLQRSARAGGGDGTSRNIRTQVATQQMTNMRRTDTASRSIGEPPEGRDPARERLRSGARSPVGWWCRSNRELADLADRPPLDSTPLQWNLGQPPAQPRWRGTACRDPELPRLDDRVSRAVALHSIRERPQPAAIRPK
jgi:hypothetical protein